MSVPLRIECTRLADQLERSFRGGAWHGPALLEILGGVKAPAAQWRPLPESHSIAELVGHLTFWMENTCGQLGGAPATGHGEWGQGEPLTESEWAETVKELVASHRNLQAALEALDDARLDDPAPGSDPTLRSLLLGTLQHNAYHAGQIALLRRQIERISGALT